MTRARIAGGVALAAVIAAGGWQGVRFLHDGQAEAQSAPQATAPIAPAPKRDDSDGGVVTIDTPQSGDAEQGATPMAQRIAVLGVLTSVVSVFFYFRIIVQMYMSDETAPGHRPRVPAVALAGMLIALVVVFYLGIVPGQLLTAAADSVATIF